MSYTFGASVDDDINWAGDFNGFGGAIACQLLLCGWFHPTTLTAGRGLFAFGDTSGAEIDTATAELRFRALGATTTGQWTTSGVNLAVNEWKFIAVLNTVTNTGPSVAFRVWVGTLTE